MITLIHDKRRFPIVDSTGEEYPSPYMASYWAGAYKPHYPLPVAKTVWSDDYYYWYLTWLLTELYGKVKS